MNFTSFSHYAYRQHRECRSTASGLWRTWCWGTNIPTKALSHLCSTAFFVSQTLGMRAQVRPLAVITSHRRAVWYASCVVKRTTSSAFVADIIYTTCHINTDDEKPSPVSASGSAGPLTAPPAKPTPHVFLDRLQELKTCRCALLFECLIQFCICKTSLIPHWVPPGVHAELY